jgi:hypothetical protein
MPRRIRRWWRAAIAVPAIMSPHAAAAEDDSVSPYEQVLERIREDEYEDV